jgi:hypothetical protein
MDANTARSGVLLAAKILRRARAADQQKLVEQGRRLVGAISAVHDAVRQGDSAQTRQNAKAVVTELASALTSIHDSIAMTEPREGSRRVASQGSESNPVRRYSGSDVLRPGPIGPRDAGRAAAVSGRHHAVSPEAAAQRRVAELREMQARMQEQAEAANLLSQMQSLRHQTAMRMIGNIR